MFLDRPVSSVSSDFINGHRTRTMSNYSTSTSFGIDGHRSDFLLGVKPEHVWYEKLAEAKVPHLVGFKHASDVVPSTLPVNYHGPAALDPTETTSRDGAQRGLTSRLKCLFPSGLQRSLQGHIHYRLVQSEICRPLSEFTNSRHLVLVVLDSLKGEKWADLDVTVPLTSDCAMQHARRHSWMQASFTETRASEIS